MGVANCSWLCAITSTRGQWVDYMPLILILDDTPLQCSRRFDSFDTPGPIGKHSVSLLAFVLRVIVAQFFKHGFDW